MKIGLFNKKNKIRQSSSDKTFNTILLIIATFILVIIVYPLIYIVSSSFSSGSAINTGRVFLWPVDFTLDGYKLVFANRLVWIGYGNTIFYTVLATCFNMFLTILTAYPLARKNFQGRSFLTKIFLIPMFVGGGIIPTYILVSNLNLTNTRAAMIVLGGLSIYNMIMMRTYFASSIPQELLESAKMDGITDIGYLLKIVLPLSKAILSVIILYYMVGHWNSYFSAMIYLRDRDLYPLQLVLRDILLTSTGINVQEIVDPKLAAQMQSLADVMKYALVIVSSVPMIIIYPFIQKFFEKGVMVGSVKG